MKTKEDIWMTKKRRSILKGAEGMNRKRKEEIINGSEVEA
jgi:hypothetical protein